MPEFIEVCKQAARAGGAELLRWRGRIHAREKGPKDLVTEADLASQELIQRMVVDAFPDHRFLGEEDAGDAWSDNLRGYCWVVDPLDGTTNFVHDMPAFSVSVALTHDGLPVAGVVYDPILDECFAAARGEGATLNDEAIKVSDCISMPEALLAASFSAHVSRDSIEITRFVEVLTLCQALRRLGSAALNMCYVACGRLDGYWASSVKAWDVAAGAIIIAEAGGVLTDLEGAAFDLADPKLISTSTTALHGRLLDALAKAEKRYGEKD